MFGLDFFEMTVDKEFEAAIVLAETEAKEFFEMEEAAHNFLPLLIVRRIGEAALILGIVELSLRIMEDHLPAEAPARIFAPP